MSKSPRIESQASNNAIEFRLMPKFKLKSKNRNNKLVKK